MSHKTVAQVKADAKRVRDPDARAKVYEQALARVDKPAKLLEPWLEALWKTELDADACARKVADVCLAIGDGELLGAAGLLLDHYRQPHVRELLVAGHAAGMADEEALCLYGRILVQGGDPAGERILRAVIDGNTEWAEPRIVLALIDPDPARGLALLDAIDDDEPHRLEARAALYAKLGRADEANSAVTAALAEYDSRREGLRDLCEWHVDEARYGRALVHARALQAMKKRDAETDELIVGTFRVAGAFAELVPWLETRCADDVPGELAWDLACGLDDRHPLKRRALAALIAASEEPSAQLVWRIEDARLAAVTGDVGVLDAIGRALGDDAAGWAALGSAYFQLRLLAAARAAADRAVALARTVETLSIRHDVAFAEGDVAAARATAEDMIRFHPEAHEGPERLAWVLARIGDRDGALAHSHRAVMMAPDCPNAWTARGEALVLAAELDEARSSVDRATRPGDEEPGSELAMLRCALAGDPKGLEHHLAAHATNFAVNVWAAWPEHVARLRAVALQPLAQAKSG